MFDKDHSIHKGRSFPNGEGTVVYLELSFISIDILNISDIIYVIQKVCLYLTLTNFR